MKDRSDDCTQLSCRAAPARRPRHRDRPRRRARGCHGSADGGVQRRGRRGFHPDAAAEPACVTPLILSPGGVPLTRPRHHGSAPGGVLCAVPYHLCTVLGCGVRKGIEPLALPIVRQERWPITRRPSGLCTPPRQLPAPPLRVSPADRPPSWNAGSARRVRESPGQARRPAHAARRQATRTASSAPTAAGARTRTRSYPQPHPPQP